jgi:hypothetical protein
MQAMPETRQQSFEEIYGPPENFLEIEVRSHPHQKSPSPLLTILPPPILFPSLPLPVLFPLLPPLQTHLTPFLLG